MGARESFRQFEHCSDCCQKRGEHTCHTCELLEEINGWEGKEKQRGGVAFFYCTHTVEADDWELLNAYNCLIMDRKCN